MKPRVFSLQSFEHFDVIAMVDKSRDNGKLFTICLFFFVVAITLTVLNLHCSFSERHERGKIQIKIQIAPPSRHFHGLYSYRP